MLKKISLMILALMYQSPCMASCSKKSNSTPLQAVTVMLSENDLDDEIVCCFVTAEIDCSVRVDIDCYNNQYCMKADNEDGHSCCMDLYAKITDCLATIFSKLQQEKMNKIN